MSNGDRKGVSGEVHLKKVSARFGKTQFIQLEKKPGVVFDFGTMLKNSSEDLCSPMSDFKKQLREEEQSCKNCRSETKNTTQLSLPTPVNPLKFSIFVLETAVPRIWR